MKKKLLIPLLLLTALICAAVWYAQQKNSLGFDGSYTIPISQIHSGAWGSIDAIDPAESISVVYSYGFGVYEDPSPEEVSFRQEVDAFLSSYRFRKGENLSSLLPPAGGVEIAFADGCSPYRVYWSDSVLWVPYNEWIPYQPEDPETFDRQLKELVSQYNETNSNI